MDWNDAAESLRKMRGEIDSILDMIEGNQETPEQEGERMFREGTGLSNVWGDCSKLNFPHIERVLDAYVAASKVVQNAQPMAVASK